MGVEGWEPYLFMKEEGGELVTGWSSWSPVVEKSGGEKFHCGIATAARRCSLSIYLHGFAEIGRLKACQNFASLTALCKSNFKFQLALLACPAQTMPFCQLDADDMARVEGIHSHGLGPVL